MLLIREIGQGWPSLNRETSNMEVAMKTQPWHSTESSDSKVYHDNDHCSDGNHVDSNKRTSGTDNLPKCEECDRLDRDETGNSNFESDAGYGNSPDKSTTQKNASGDRFGDRKDRTNDQGNPNNPSPSHPSGPTNPTDPANHDWNRQNKGDDWKSGNWDRTKKE